MQERSGSQRCSSTKVNRLVVPERRGRNVWSYSECHPGFSLLAIDMHDSSSCTHDKVVCLNPYEYIRKYRCGACGEVMMCACDEEFGRRFLPHQLRNGTELETQLRTPVTIGFQGNICNSCRGIPEQAHPKAEIYGSTSKVERYYWREIHFETTRRFAEWYDQHGYTDYETARREQRDVHATIRKDVLGIIKDLHSRSPKYSYQEKSQEHVIRENKVEVVRLDGRYGEHVDGRSRIIDEGKLCSPEEFAARHYHRQGYKALFLESTPFHVLFAVFMWLLIQDQGDPLVRIVGIGDRRALDEGGKGGPIWTHLPEDFGTRGYAKRRGDAINEHFAGLPLQAKELIWMFNYWLEPSFDLRQYLWAYRTRDVERAREVLSILPGDVIHRILRYLVSDYWKRYTGWPDLLLYNFDDYFFAEVKSSKDKLRQDQKSWIQGNTGELFLPFRLVKIHRMSV